jgi:hypothetical protein
MVKVDRKIMEELRSAKYGLGQAVYFMFPPGMFEGIKGFVVAEYIIYSAFYNWNIESENKIAYNLMFVRYVTKGKPKFDLSDEFIKEDYIDSDEWYADSITRTSRRYYTTKAACLDYAKRYKVEKEQMENE